VNSSEAEWVTVAVLGKTHGNRGELTAIPLSSRPERYQSLAEVYLFGAGERHTVESAWFHGGILILKLSGIDSISQAEEVRGCEVRIPYTERVPLDPGEFFLSDLVGCEVVEQRNGALVGHVTSWQDAGGAGILALDNGILIPFARSICVEIDPAARRIRVELPEGLKELNP
jgi:16S rRNA processing protein RimM